MSQSQVIIATTLQIAVLLIFVALASYLYPQMQVVVYLCTKLADTVLIQLSQKSQTVTRG